MHYIKFINKEQFYNLYVNNTNNIILFNSTNKHLDSNFENITINTISFLEYFKDVIELLKYPDNIEMLKRSFKQLSENNNKINLNILKSKEIFSKLINQFPNKEKIIKEKLFYIRQNYIVIFIEKIDFIFIKNSELLIKEKISLTDIIDKVNNDNLIDINYSLLLSCILYVILKLYKHRQVYILSTKKYLFNNDFKFNIIYNTLNTSCLPNIILKNKIYIGNKNSAKNYNILSKLNIYSIINCSNNTPNIFENDSKFNYLKIDIDDFEDSKIYLFFDIVYEFIEKNNNHPILIHCNKGRSRSACFIVMYLLKKYKKPLDITIKYITKCRSEVQINDGFIEQLKYFEKNNN